MSWMEGRRAGSRASSRAHSRMGSEAATKVQYCRSAGQMSLEWKFKGRSAGRALTRLLFKSNMDAGERQQKRPGSLR